jgi:transcriptional regulator with XRE-family HTH domain
MNTPSKVRKALGGFSQAAVARQAGVTDSYMSLVLSGQRTPRLPVAARIARVLGVSLDEFSLYLELLKKQRGQQGQAA